MRILIIGDMEGQLSQAAGIAFEKGAKVTHSRTSEAGLTSLLGGRGADLVMIDVNEDIPYFVASLKRERIVVPIVACGVDTDDGLAAESIHAGAKEFLPLPPSPDLIAAILAAVADDERPAIATDPAMKSVMMMADRVAPTDASVMICGESGVGKEVLARHLHRCSRRVSGSFITVNCAAIPENLLESELFGHEKGAFTGATSRRIGKFEEADGGTLLLDEVTEMDARLQAKLLRAVQEREIDRVGGTRSVPVNIRIISTSNRDLREAVSSGIFREDLLYRLNVVNIHIPPLRERRSDITALAEYFIRKYALANGLPVKGLSAEAAAMIREHPWRGNVRELENAMHRAVILSRGPEIGMDLLDSEGSGRFRQGEESVESGGGDIATEAVSKVGRTVAEVEQDLILSTLDHCLGNRTRAAHILGISIRTLRNKLRTYSGAGAEVAAPGGVRGAAPMCGETGGLTRYG